MPQQSKKALIKLSAGLWASAAAVELWMQWRLLTPPLSDYFGTVLVIAIVGVYALVGGFLGLLGSWALPWSEVRLPFLVFIPLFVATLGVFAPAGGFVTAKGLLAGLIACLGMVLMTKIRLLCRVGSMAWIVVLIPVMIGVLSQYRSGPQRVPDKNITGSLPPNVVLLTIDTLRPDHLGLRGYPRRTSPHLDSLASCGVVFSEAYAPMPCTAPSHASIMTGKYPLNHGVLRNGGSLPRDSGTLAESFRSAGYRTGAFVGVAHLAAAFGWGRGFDYFADQGWFDRLFPYSGLRMVRASLRLVSAGFSRPASEVVDAVLRWLNSIGNEPFFLWIHLWDPHDPYAPPASFVSTFENPAAIPVETAYTREQIERWIDGYDGEVNYVDRELERVWKALRDQGLSERTAIFIVSDHGESLGERSYRGHSIFLYEEQIRVLLLCVSPTLRHLAGGSVDGPVSLVDLAPTILEIAGIEGALVGGDGHSLVSLTAGSALSRRPVLMEADMWGFSAKAVRYGGKKLIIHLESNPSHRGFAPGADRSVFSTGQELFDLDVDPEERTNLAAAYPETVSMLRTMIEQVLPASTDSTSSSELSARTEDALRELGYLD